MLDELSRPAVFGGKIQPDEFYSSVSTVVASLRGRATLRTISLHLNALGLKTATGLEFNRARLANFIQQNPISTITG